MSYGHFVPKTHSAFVVVGWSIPHGTVESGHGVGAGSFVPIRLKKVLVASVLLLLGRRILVGEVSLEFHYPLLVRYRSKNKTKRCFN